MKAKVIGLQILNAFILGITYAVSKFGLQQMESMQLLSFRFVFATAIIVLGVLSGKMKVDFRMKFHPLLLIYCIQPILYYILEVNALQLLPAAYVSIVLSAAPITMSLFGYMLLSERITMRHFVCLLISTGGVVGINLYGVSANAGLSALGFLYALGALFLNGLGAVFCKIMLQTYSTTTLTCLDMSVKAIAFTAIGLIQTALGGLPLLSFFAPLRELPGILAIAFLGLFPSVVFNIIQYYCLRNTKVSTISVFINLTPVFTVIVGAIFLHEQVGAMVVICLIVVVLGLSAYILEQPSEASKGQANLPVDVVE